MNRHPLSPGGNTLVVLDTCVLLPSRLSDVLFDLMLAGQSFNNAHLIEGYRSQATRSVRSRVFGYPVPGSQIETRDPSRRE